MLTFHENMDTDALELLIEQLSREIGRMREAGPLTFQDAQLTASSLTRAQLVLNELVRSDLNQRGLDQDMAERFVDLESKLRILREQVYREMRCRVPATS